MHLNTRYKKFNRETIVLLPLLLCVLFFWHSASFAAGYRVLETDGMRISLWYPTDVPVEMERLGPFDTEMAKDAPIRKGNYEVVLLSHGITGHARNHHVTAQVLADAGFVVVAPQHQGDHLVGGKKTARLVDNRYRELDRALKVVRADSEFGAHLASEPVHGIGYSLGGLTMMLASGAKYSLDKSKQHCDINEKQDGKYCNYFSFFQRLFQSFGNKNPPLRPSSELFTDHVSITGKVVIVASTFQGLDFDTPLSMSELLVIAIDGDEIAKPEFHSKPLFDAVKDKVEANYASFPGHHFAFIAPFSKRATEDEHIPVAIDPDGFDRAAFLDEVNAAILGVMLN